MSSPTRADPPGDSDGDPSARGAGRAALLARHPGEGGCPSEHDSASRRNRDPFLGIVRFRLQGQYGPDRLHAVRRIGSKCDGVIENLPNPQPDLLGLMCPVRLLTSAITSTAESARHRQTASTLGWLSPCATVGASATVRSVSVL